MIHTGLNLSRSFEVMHGRSVVIGDVNSNNVVVHRNSTTHLIDCDSFQVPGDGMLFRCGVGVAEYQPPELQGRDLSVVDRLPQHDLFGLAVMIFQLLFLGKHPFAGVLPARTGGANAIGDNVAARRYFYGVHAVRMGLRPPPGSLTLTAVTPEIAALFGAAFVGNPAARPSAAAWRGALADLEQRTVACRRDPQHRYADGAACPWCELERSGLHYFSLNPGGELKQIDESIWQRFGDRDVEAAWTQIAHVRAPAQVEPAIPHPRRYVTSPAGLWSAALATRFALGAAVFVLGVLVLLSAGQPFLAVCLGILALTTGAACRPDARAIAAARRTRRAQASAAYETAKREWYRAARGADFADAREGLGKLCRALHEQRALLAHERQALARSGELRERRAFLERHLLAGSGIAMDARSRATLAAHGIDTAAAVGEAALRRVPGIPIATKQQLLGWRANLERTFRLQPGGGAADMKRLRELHLRHIRRRESGRRELLAGPARLRGIAAATERKRSALRHACYERGEAYRRAEADLRLSPLLYRL